jgi:hypothetical protein
MLRICTVYIHEKRERQCKGSSFLTVHSISQIYPLLIYSMIVTCLCKYKIKSNIKFVNRVLIGKEHL